MMELVTRNYWWSKIMKDMKKYIYIKGYMLENEELYRSTGRKTNGK